MAPHASIETTGLPTTTNRNEQATTVSSPTTTEAMYHLYPTATARPLSGEEILEKQGKLLSYYEDGRHPDYQFVRVPKIRDYELFRVQRGKPEDGAGNRTELPLTAIRKEDGAPIILWAKMDTGADINLINQSTVTALYGENAPIHRITMSSRRTFNMIDAAEFTPTRAIYLDFSAGLAEKKFEKVSFVVIKDNAAISNQDGVPNVLLGQPFLEEHSMIMVDLNYCHEPDPSLPVLAQRASKEQPGLDSHGILPLVIKMVNKPGLPRPPRPSGR